jgi:hypothetical protein
MTSIPKSKTNTLSKDQMETPKREKRERERWRAGGGECCCCISDYLMEL